MNQVTNESGTQGQQGQQKRNFRKLNFMLDRFLPTVAASAALYLVLSPRVAKPLYRSLLFHPSPYPGELEQPPEISGVVGKEVFFPGPAGRKLHGWFYKHVKPKFTVLLSHGNAGNITNRLQTINLLLEASTSVFIYDYQGYGKSEGTADIPEIYNDAAAAYDYVIKEESIAPEDILLYGESLGAAVSCHLSTMRKCRGMVLQSGFASLRRIAQETMPLLKIYPAWLFPANLLDSLSVLKNPHPPVLIIHGDQDALIACDHAKDLYEAAVGPKTLLTLPNCTHNDICYISPDEFSLGLGKFLDELAQAPPDRLVEHKAS